MNQRSIDIINDMLKNHLPRIIEGLEKGYIDENEVLAVYGRLVRARILEESLGRKPEAPAERPEPVTKRVETGAAGMKGMQALNVTCDRCKQVVHGFEARDGETLYTSGFVRLAKRLHGKGFEVVWDECLGPPQCLREEIRLTEQLGKRIAVPEPVQPTAPLKGGVKRLVYKFMLDGEEREWPRDVITAVELLGMAIPESLRGQYSMFMETPGDGPDAKVEESNLEHPYFLRENSITKRFYTVPAATFGEESLKAENIRGPFVRPMRGPIVGGDNSHQLPIVETKLSQLESKPIRCCSKFSEVSQHCTEHSTLR